MDTTVKQIESGGIIRDIEDSTARENMHEHINKSTIDKISESVEGTLLFNGEEIKGGGDPYELPSATATTLGGIKVGENLTIDADGTLNAQAGGGEGGTTNNYLGIDEYSEDERVIGKWVNGKPLYRKVVSASYNANANVWSVIYATDISIDKLINCIVYSSVDTSHNPTIGYMHGHYSAGSVQVYSNSLNVSAGDTVILEYTKTTDAENSFTPDMLKNGIIEDLDEIYIGTKAPTGGNYKIWIDTSLL